MLPGRAVFNVSALGALKSDTFIENRLAAAKGKGVEGGVGRSLGLADASFKYSMEGQEGPTVCRTELQSTSVTNHNGKEHFKKNVYMCGAELLCCTAEIGLYRWLGSKESACNVGGSPQWRRCRFSPWIGKIPWRRKMATHSSILGWEIP